MLLPFTVSTVVLLGLLDGCTRASCSQFHGFHSSSVGAKDEGRAFDGSPSLVPLLDSQGADVSAKAPGYFLILYNGCSSKIYWSVLISQGLQQGFLGVGVVQNAEFGGQFVGQFVQLRSG